MNLQLERSLPIVKLATISSVVFIFFLCFIDEGAYNLNWMLNFGNWIVFVLYTIIFTLIQLLLIGTIYSIGHFAGFEIPRRYLMLGMVLTGLSTGLWLIFQIFG